MHGRRVAIHGSPLADLPPRGERPTCSVDGCDKPHHSKGYCDAHKMRLWRFGDTESRRRVAQPKPPKEDQRSPIRAAYEAGDSQALVAAILADTQPTESGCREWQRKVRKDGYASVGVAGRTVGVHRLMAEALHGDLHGEPVHHICANTRCVEPTHLQPISQRENAAEMLERKWYRSRIAELEAALEAYSSSHPLLTRRAG